MALVILAAAINYFRPLPTPVATLGLKLPAGASQPALAWPGGGQAAVAASGYGLLGTNGDQKPLATASIAKIITTLCVLQKLPLQPGQSGPTYTVSADDVAIYNNYVAQDGSVMQVVAGEKLTEYQALEALLIPSANNVADSLVHWVFGSQTAYADYATAYLEQHGLDQTHIGSDASGFDPSTTSTASDLTSLGLLALKSPVLMQIAGEQQATLPVVGTVYNYDTILGQAGITGLKTGNNDADPGAFLFTASARYGGKEVLLTGTVMDADSLEAALASAVQLSASLQQGFEQTTIATPSQAVGRLQAAWGASSPIVTSGPLQLVRWKGTPLSETHRLDTGVRNGTIGQLKIAAGQAQSQTDLKLQHAVAGPSFWWRLTRH